MRKTVKINGTNVVLEANGYTLLVYEDRFKGRRLLQDIGEISKIGEAEKVPFSIQTKMLWAAAKTADDTLPDIYEWTKQFSIEEVIKASQIAVVLICESLSTSKKAKATAKPRFIYRLLKFFHLQSKTA